MNISIKDFNVKMEVKTQGIELEVKTPDGSRHLGDLVITKSKLIWCQGKTRRENGVAVTWNQFIEMMTEDSTA